MVRETELPPIEPTESRLSRPERTESLLARMRRVGVIERATPSLRGWHEVERMRGKGVRISEIQVNRSLWEATERKADLGHFNVPHAAAATLRLAWLSSRRAAPSAANVVH